MDEDRPPKVEGHDGLMWIRGSGIFIAPGVPHEVHNLSDTEPVVAVVARSSADEWDRIILYARPDTGIGNPRRG